MSMQTRRYRKVFSRVETDAEFVARLCLAYPLPDWARKLTGETLDDFAEHNFEKQRRIVEDVES